MRKSKWVWVMLAVLVMSLLPMTNNVQAAGKSLEDGVYTVGTDIPAGLNTFISTVDAAEITVIRGNQEMVYEVLEQEKTDYPDRFTARLKAGDKVEVFLDTYEAQLIVQPATKPALSKMSAGLYTVGTDIPAGTYNLVLDQPVGNYDWVDLFLYDSKNVDQNYYQIEPKQKPLRLKLATGDQVYIATVIGTMSFTPVILVPQSIDFDKTAVSVMVNKTTPITATIKPATATNKEVTWASSNPAVATVVTKGNVKGIKVGTATITATAKGATAVKRSIPVTVTKVLPTGMTLSKKTLNIANNQTLKVTATIAPADAAVKTVLWKSSNPKVATVDAAGNIKGLVNGTAKITATAKDNAKVIQTVTVNVSTKNVKLNKTSLTLLAGKTETLKATVSPADSTDKAVTWKSSNTKVATVDAKGKVTAKAKGTANITATVKGAKVATTKITVTAPIAASSVKLNSTSLTVVKGKTATLTGTVSPSNTTNKTLTWKSSNTKVATVDSKGKVTAVGSGTAKITATTTNGKVASATVTVPYQKSLSAGTWKAGTHLPAGRYRITTTSGSGNLIIADNAYDRFVNEILSSKPDDFGVTVVTTDIKAGDSIKIMGLNSVQFSQVKHSYSNTLHSGYWTVGKDIAPGSYRITTPSGSGNLIAWSGSRLLVNEILESKTSSYGVTSVTTTFKTGDRIQIAGLEKVVFTKK